MKLDLREEKRRDNTKGIKDIGKASTAELNRTIDTGSPAAPEAKVEIKDRKEKEKAKAKSKDAKTSDTDTKDAETQDSTDVETQKPVEGQKELQKEYKLFANKIRGDLRRAKETADNPSLFQSALIKILDFAERRFNQVAKDVLNLDLEQEGGIDVQTKSIFDVFREKIKGQDKVEDLEQSAGDFESILGRLADPTTFNKVKSILDAKGIKSASDYNKMSKDEKDDLMSEIDIALLDSDDESTEKPKDENPKDEKPKDEEPKDDKSDDKEKKTNAVREALEKVYSVKRSNKYASIRTLLNNMKEN